MDISHGQEVKKIKTYTYYYSKDSNKNYEFLSMIDKIMKLINNYEDFTVEVKIGSINNSDVYLQTK